MLLEPGGKAPGTPEAIKKVIPITTVIVLPLRVVFIITNVRWLAVRTLVVLYALVSGVSDYSTVRLWQSLVIRTVQCRTVW
jgi:hypothetical protein